MLQMPHHHSGAALLSVGYERRDLDELVALLVDHNVHTLVDVRLNPISRKKGFSKTALSSALADAGIEYRHERKLGNPKANRQPFRQGLTSAWIRYRHHLTNGASEALADVVALATTRRVALLCYEREHGTCHRSCITDAVLNDNPALQVVEI